MARREVLIAPAAEKDLFRLYAYIRDHGGGAKTGIDFVRRIRAQCEALRDFPERGNRRDDIRPGLRIIGFERRVVIAFTVNDRKVRIGRIFYGCRNYEALMGAKPESGR